MSKKRGAFWHRVKSPTETRIYRHDGLQVATYNPQTGRLLIKMPPGYFMNLDIIRYVRRGFRIPEGHLFTQYSDIEPSYREKGRPHHMDIYHQE